MTDPEPSGETPATKQPGFRQVASAVFWGFFGVRKRSAMSADVANIKLLHVVVVGVVAAAIFVLALIALVTIVTRAAS
jgi:hypothetical protein